MSTLATSGKTGEGEGASLPSAGHCEPKPERKEDAAPLSEEEQMEQFEEALKEADWGHQPC